MAQVNVSTLLGKTEVGLTFTDKPVSAWGGLTLFAAFARSQGIEEAIRQALPFQVTSPNATNLVEIVTAFISGVITGSRRFVHLERLRQDAVVRCILGLKRYASVATFSRFFNRFGRKQIEDMFTRLEQWQMNKVAQARHGSVEGETMDLDSSVFERYGHQEGSLVGFNPKKHRRPSHHPIFAVWAEEHIVVHSWLRSGNTGSARGAKEFLTEALQMLPEGTQMRRIRADSGFAIGTFLDYIEEQGFEYAVASKFTRVVQHEIAKIREWRIVDYGIFVGEVEYQAQGWAHSRRVVIIKERNPKGDFIKGRELFDDPAYVYQAIISNCTEEPENVWRFYRGRSDSENRIRELKHDYGIDGFCFKRFYATEAAFRLVCLTHNLLVMMGKQLGYDRYRTLGTIRYQHFVCGAVLGKEGRKPVIRLSLRSPGLREQFLEHLRRLFTPDNINCVAVESG